MSVAHFSDAAVQDLREIRDYIARDNQDAALKLLDDFEEIFDLLAKQPGIGQQRDDLMPGIRFFPVRKSNCIFYREVDDGVEVVRIVNARRDFGRLFDL